jgi:hypothetical protein
MMKMLLKMVVVLLVAIVSIQSGYAQEVHNTQESGSKQVIESAQSIKSANEDRFKVPPSYTKLINKKCCPAFPWCCPPLQKKFPFLLP